jgi:hypothetical protein
MVMVAAIRPLRSWGMLPRPCTGFPDAEHLAKTISLPSQKWCNDEKTATATSWKIAIFFGMIIA